MEHNYSSAFKEFPDITKEKYKSEDRFHLDGSAAVDWFEHVEHPGWKAEAAYALTELAYGEAYDTGDPDAERFAMDVHENVAKPYTEFCFGSRDELPDVDIEPYRPGLEAIDATTKQYGFQALLVKSFPSPRPAPYSYRDPHDYMEFADALKEQVDPDAYDVIYTAWSKGIPLLDVAADRLDIEPEQQVVMRYSPSLKDTEPQATPAMQDRAADAGNRRFLFVDDVLMKGGTAENAYKWAREQGAETVDAFIPCVMDWTDHFDEDAWPNAAGRTLFNMDEQPAVQQYRVPQSQTD